MLVRIALGCNEGQTWLEGKTTVISNREALSVINGTFLYGFTVGG
jgi:hypothetical protein